MDIIKDMKVSAKKGTLSTGVIKRNNPTYPRKWPIALHNLGIIKRDEFGIWDGYYLDLSNYDTDEDAYNDICKEASRLASIQRKEQKLKYG